MNELILIVEDSQTQAMLLENILERHHYRVAIVENGGKALNWLSENKPSLVISDIIMLELNGYEATRQIRQFNKDVIVIAQAGFLHDNDKEQAIDAGCNDYISKPIKKAELLAIIQKYFKK